jgi:serine/threonine protein phosphatase 1
MTRQFAISDIHGCLRSFDALLDHIAFSTTDTLYLLGDYVDRGPDSKAVIDRIWQLQANGYTVHCLAGNHEQIICEYYGIARKFGGHTVSVDEFFMKSFQVQYLDQVPENYITWMAQLPLYLEIPGYVLVHAGLNFNNSDPFEDQKALTWIRNWYYNINYDWLGDRVIVHGHTPMGMQQIKQEFAQLQQRRVLDIDGGCATMRLPNACLCAFDLSNKVVHFVPSIR